MASIEPEQEVIATVPDDTLRPDHDALAVPGEPVSSIDGGEYAMQPDPDDIVASREARRPESACTGCSS